MENRSADPYVKVQLLMNETSRQKKATEIRTAELNPVFNETMVLDLPLDMVDEVVCIIQVSQKHVLRMWKVIK